MPKKKISPKPKKSLVKVSIQEYSKIFLNVKNTIAEAQIRAAAAANQELINLYWAIGKIMHSQQELAGWGSKFIEKLTIDIQNEFPGIEGFSRSNLFRMKAFYLAYPNCLPPVRQFTDMSDLSILSRIPWAHNIVLIEKIKSAEERLWYAQKAIESGWSRNVLAMQIDSNLYKRQGKAITNFAKTLPSPQSDMAQQSLKDPYIFDFLTLQQDYAERDVELGLINNVQKLLLEMGKGFAFVARQYHLNVNGDDYYLDLLFYHFTLRCFVVVELKAGKFEPRDAGQLNFYLSAIDNQLKSPYDNPTIGILLCKTKNKLVAEYALKDINKPMGVADYEALIVEKLPKQFKKSLPSIEEIEAELEKQAIMVDNTNHLLKRKTKNTIHTRKKATSHE